MESFSAKITMNISRIESTLIIMMLIVTTSVLGYFDKMNPENILFTIAGGIIGATVPVGRFRDKDGDGIPDP